MGNTEDKKGQMQISNGSPRVKSCTRMLVNNPCRSRVHLIVKFKQGKNVTDSEFLVIKGTGVPLLGKETAMKLNVLKIGIDVAAVTDLDCEIRRQYLSVFQGVGKLKSKQVTLHIDTSVQPVAQPLRRMPFNLREKVETKIDELLDLDIIERVDGPTPWVNPVVVVPKSGGDIRMCLDMRRGQRSHNSW